MTPEALREWRRVRGLTQQQLADRIGLLPRQIQRYEAGTTKIPKLLEIFCEEH